MRDIIKKYGQWLKSIFIIIFILLSFFIAIVGYTLYAFYENALKASSDLSYYVKNHYDAQFSAIVELSVAIELNNLNIEISNLESNQSDLPNIKMHTLSNYLSDFQIANPLLKSIYIYYAKLDYVVGTLGSFSARNYYQLNNNFTLEKQNEWIETLSVEKSGLYLVQQSTGEVPAYISKANNDTYIVFEINTDQMLYEQTAAQMQFAHTLFAFELEEQFFVSDSDSELLFEYLEDGDNELFQRINSDFDSLVYYNLYYQEQIFQPYLVSLYVAGGGMLLCLVFSISASFYLSKNTNKPIEQLIDQLSGSSDTPAKDIYEQLQICVSQLLDEKNGNIDKIMAQQEKIDRMFLDAALSGKLNTELAILAATRRYNVEFEHPFFQLLAIKKRGVFNKKDLDVISMKFKAHYDTTICSQSGNYIIVLLNLSDEYKYQNHYEKIQQLNKTLLGKNNTITALSYCYDSLEKISFMYSQVVNVLDFDENLQFGFTYKHHTKPNDINDYSDAGIMLFNEFSTAIIEKNWITADSLLQPVFGKFLAQTSEIKLREIRFCAIQENLFYLATTFSNERKKDYKQQILNCTNGEDLHKVAKEILYAASYDDKHIRTGKNTAMKAKEIIEKNYTDPLLGLYFISDQLEVSSSYISASFKSAYEIGVVNYINQLRIKDAKVLITDTDMTIKEIAAAVGFSSDISFIRTFKKLENCTPNALRKT